MKVLHVKNVANVGKNLVSGLCQLGVNAELYEMINIDKSELPKLIKNIIGLLIAIYELGKFYLFIKKNKFDIIHIHYGTFSYLAILTNTPFFLHIHGSDLRKAIHQPITGWFIRKGINLAIKVFYTTPDLEKAIRKIRGDAIFFPNPIDITKIKEVCSNHREYSDVFNISKIDEDKGIETNLDTIESLKESNYNLKVAILGFGNAYQDYSNKLQEISQGENIHLLNQMPHERMISCMKQTKIILGQMKLGSLGCSELEAMACGKPVVCNFSFWSHYPTPPPLISVSDAKEAKEAIINLIKSPEKAQNIGKKASQWIEENYDIKPTAKKLHKIYQAYLESANV